MVCASRLAESLGRIDAELTQRQIRLLAAVGLPTKLPDLPHEKLWRAMQHDKKVEHGRLRFVLPTRMGHVELVPDIDASQVMAVLQVSH
jgi:3-dehydroquinate synthase